MSFQDATPPNISQLVSQANDKTSYQNRLHAVEELSQWRCQQSRDVLRRLMMNDKVYAVQEASFRKLQAFGEAVRLPKQKPGHLIKDINKKLIQISDSFDGAVDLETFKQRFKTSFPEAYDVYSFEKRDKFDQWIENVLKSAPKKGS